MLYRALHLEQDEHVTLEVRRHWIVFVGYALNLIIFAVLPFVLFVLVKTFMPEFVGVSLVENKKSLFLFIYTLWLLFLWISFFIAWTNYYLDVWYVTEKRIIAVEQKNLFHREVSNLRFEKIQDITLEVHGFIPTLLRFSDIRVQTASEDSKSFFMRSVRHPEEVRRVIFSHQNKIGDNKTSGVI